MSQVSVVLSPKATWVELNPNALTVGSQSPTSARAGTGRTSTPADSMSRAVPVVSQTLARDDPNIRSPLPGFRARHRYGVPSRSILGAVLRGSLDLSLPAALRWIG